MLIKLLGVLDIVVGLCILFTPTFSFIQLIIYMILIKGVISIISNIASGFFFDFMGILDVLAGLSLFGLFNNWSFFLSPIIGIGMIIKGIISLI